MITFSWSTVLYFLIGLAGINVLVIFHEFGHYFAAKACGIRVQSVSFGMGPAFRKFYRGETEFRLCVIPFGGATTMAGNDDLKRALREKSRHIENCEDGSIFAVSPIRRIITYLSGPFANLLFAVICFIILLVIPVLSVSLTSQVKVSSPDCAAAVAGLEDGETIISVGATPVSDWNSLKSALESRSSDPIVQIITNTKVYYVSPQNGVFGLLPYGTYNEMETPGKPFFQAVGLAIKECRNQIVTFADAITGVLLGRNRLGDTLGGAFSTSENIGMITEKSFEISFDTGIRVVLYLLASVSISLGMANMLPITALDGGLILISFAEMIAGHSLRPRTYIILQVSGLVVVLVLIPVLRLFI